VLVTPVKTVKPLYKLQDNIKENSLINSLGESGSEEKIDHNLYLKRSHWEFLDRLADLRGVSRNQVARDLLDSIMEEEKQ